MDKNSNIGRIVTICLAVSLILIGASALVINVTGRKIITNTHTTFIATRWHAVGYDSSGNRLSPDPNQPLTRMYLQRSKDDGKLKLVNIFEWDFAKEWHNQNSNLESDNPTVIDKSLDQIADILKDYCKGSVLIFDATKTTAITARTNDIILLYENEPDETETNIEYQYSVASDKKCKFAIVKAKGTGQDIIYFKIQLGKGKFKHSSIFINVEQ